MLGRPMAPWGSFLQSGCPVEHRDPHGFQASLPLSQRSTQPTGLRGTRKGPACLPICLEAEKEKPQSPALSGPGH